MRVEYEHDADGSRRWRVETDAVVERAIVRRVWLRVTLLALALTVLGFPGDLIAWLLR